MSKKNTVKAYIDTIPNTLKTPKQINQYKIFLREELENNIDEIVNRYKELPSYIIHDGKYSEVFIESRKLYIEGKFYSCIAMCGITAEMIAKELLKDIILFKKDNKGYPPTTEQSEKLDRINMNIICGLLANKKLDNSFKKIAKLRNNYVHGTIKNRENDAKNAIKYLDEIIKGSISIFKNHNTKK